MGLVWLFKHYVPMGMDFQIWVWVVLALAVILVVVLIAWLVDAWWSALTVRLPEP
jgi:hypothetical protein